MQQKLNQVSQFSGGMIKDLHPIMMSNTALTDCLNGTLITFNGNEFALQNDMGNYAFKYGSLSNGFVPVGIKEFGGILYIISYNPISNRVEIGSFPSQKTIFTAIDSGAQNNFTPLELNAEVNLYSNVVKDSLIKIFSKEETFFLNPGDKYYLSLQNNTSDDTTWEKLNELLNWQHLTPYILTNENKLYSIEGYLEISAETKVLNKDAYNTVTWEIPGWIAAKFDINVMQEFNVFSDPNDSKIIKQESGGDVKYYSVPSNTFKFQSLWNLNNYPKGFKDYLDGGNLIYLVHNHSDLKKITKKDITDFEIKEKEKTLSSTTYNEFQTVYYGNYDFGSDGTNKKWYVVPVLKVEVPNEENPDETEFKYLIYDQFNTEIDRNPVEIDLENISIGDDTFKWNVSDDSLVLTYDVNSYPGINLRMKFKRPFADEDLETYDENPNSVDGTIIDVYKNWFNIDNLNYNGVNIKSFPFTTQQEYENYKYSDSEDNPYNTIKNTTSKTQDRYGIGHKSGSITVSNTFDKEDYYELETKFYYELNGVEEVIKTEKFNIIATEVINNWYNSVNRFQTRDCEYVINSLMDFITIENTPTLVPLESSIKGFSQITGKSFDINDDGSGLSDTEILEQKLAPDSQDTEWIRESFGDPFVEMGYTEKKSGKVFIYDGTNFGLFDKGKININLPKNQYKNQNNQDKEVGRLWRFLNPAKVKDTSKIIDSRKIPYNVDITGDKDGDYYVNNDSLLFQFYMKNDIEMTLSSRSITKSIPRTTKELTDYIPSGWKSKNWVGKKDNYGWIKGEVGVRKLSGGDGIGFGFYEYYKWIFYKFENGNLYVIKDNQNPNTFNPDRDDWKLVTFNSVITSLDLNKAGDFGTEIPTTYPKWVPWISNDQTPKKSKDRWAYYTSQAQTYAPIMFPICLYNGSSSHERIRSELFNDEFIELNRRYTAFYLPGKIPYIIYPDGSHKSAMVEAKSQAFYTFFALMWYCKVGLGVKQSIIYYPLISTSYSKATPKLFKGINLELKFEYKYSKSNSFTELDSLNGYEDYFTIPISKELSTPENEDIYVIVQSYALNTSEKSANALLEKQLEPEITKNGVLMLDSSVNDCEEIDLTEFVKDWNITAAKLTYEEDIDDKRVRIRSGDNWYIPVAKESPKTTV